jgi:uncharacterized protein (DUF427 family)
MAPFRVESVSRRVRVLFNRKFVADTTSAKFVWEHEYYPTYYLPAADVRTNYIERVSKTDDGDGHRCKLTIGNRSSDKVVWYDQGQLSGLIRLQFSEMGMFSNPFTDSLICIFGINGL